MSSVFPCLLLFLLMNGFSGAGGEDPPPNADVCGNITVSATNCTVDFFSFSHMHSSCSTGETAGTTVTMWQLFVITLPVGYECNEDSTCMLSLAAMWSRTFPLEPDKHSQALTSTVRREEMEHKVIVNVSLTLFSISNQPDTDPDYSVILSVSNCSGLSLEAGKFRLEVLEPQCAHDVPTPTQNFSTLTVTESAQCPKVNASFIGGRRDSGLYTFQWLDASNRDLCFCSSTTCIRGRYTCGWFVNDRNTCNHTAWLIIGNCTTSDAGNYTVQAFGADDSIGPPARVLLSFHLSKEDTANIGKAVSISVGTLVFLLVVAVVIVVTVLVLRNRSQLGTNNGMQLHNGSDKVIEMGSSTTCTVDGGNRQGDTMQCSVWKMTSPSKQLMTDDLIHIAQKIRHWQGLARFLGLTEPAIATIEHNHIGNYEEQKVQMLLKWFQQQSAPPTHQCLIRIIKEEMKDPVLASDVDSVLYRLGMKREDKLRSRSMLN